MKWNIEIFVLCRQQKAKSAEEETPVIVQEDDKQVNTKVNPALEEQLKRLQDERDSLLKTGVFNTEDDMILELERQIHSLIHSIDNS